MEQDRRFAYLKMIIEEWSSKYIHQLFFDRCEGDIYYYYCEFSLPTNKQPIPQGIVKAYFTVKDDYSIPGQYNVEYVFENENLRHNMNQSLVRNKFEAWIDRILYDKQKIKSVLHLGTEFESTRIIDQTGKAIDPFVERLDMLKVTNLKPYLDKDISRDVTSPRFSKQLTKKLFYLFKKADKNKNGVLEFNEFRQIIRNINQKLTDFDVQTIMATIDINTDGVIHYDEFIDSSIELIMAFLMREEAFSLKKQRDQFITKEAAKQIFWDEILKMNQLIKKLFAKCDSESGDSGLLNHTQMRECLLKCKMTTKRENNILIENYCNKDDMYEYKKFSEDMYDIRYNLAKTNLLDQNIDKIQGHIIKICEPYEKIEKNEKCISIRDLKEVLMSSKMFNLTLMQVYTLIGLVEFDVTNLINIRDFALTAKDAIKELYSYQVLEDSTRALSQGRVPFNELEEAKEYDEFELFGEFKKADINKNGHLEISEYKNCLLEAGLKKVLTAAEISTLALTADINHDNRIDYEEFMKHYRDLIGAIKFHSLLKEAANVVKNMREQIIEADLAFMTGEHIIQEQPEVVPEPEPVKLPEEETPKQGGRKQSHKGRKAERKASFIGQRERKFSKGDFRNAAPERRMSKEQTEILAQIRKSSLEVETGVEPITEAKADEETASPGPKRPIKTTDEIKRQNIITPELSSPERVNTPEKVETTKEQESNKYHYI